MPHASEILNAARETIESRRSDRDEGQERSMSRIVGAFNALTGNGLSTRDGWVFMVCLKLARAEVGTDNLDHYIDGAAYFALAGEEACHPLPDLGTAERLDKALDALRVRAERGDEP